jgi:transmembrane sensor
MDGSVDDGNEVRAQAAEWFARLKTVPVSRETLEQFFAWRRTEAHGQAFDAVERFWSTAGEASARPAILDATQAAYDRGGGDRSRPWRRWPLAAAAALVVGAAGLSLMWIDHGHHYATQVGEQRTIPLDDGSKLTLDTDTAVVIRYSQKKRRIELERGQAFFAVAHAADRPFLVDAGATQVRATGTQFEVRQLGNATEVTLVEGRVEVTSPASARPTALTSGEQLRSTGTRPAIVRRVDTRADTAWRQGRIVFDDTPLATAVAEVNRYTHQPIQLASEHYADHRLSGSFDTGDVAGFVAAATSILPLKADRNPDGSFRLAESSQTRQK